MREPNLFVYFHDRLARRLGDEGDPSSERSGGWENALTEATAFYLSCDRLALQQFVRRVTPEMEDPPVKIGTQPRGPEGTPDLVIERQSSKRLIIECKVDAGLGDQQLERYLNALRPDRGHLALFCRRLQKVPQKVLDCTDGLYLKPVGRDHFLWQDLHAWIPAADGGPLDRLRNHFRRYLERLGLEPMKPEIESLLGDRLKPANQKHQEQFGLRLAGVRRFLEKEGFRVSVVSHKGIQAVPRTETFYRHLVMWPGTSRTADVREEHAYLVQGAGLVVGFVFNPSAQRDAESLYTALASPFRDRAGRDWVVVAPRPIGGNRWRLEAVTSLDWFLADDEHIEERLQQAVAFVLREIQEFGVGPRIQQKGWAGRSSSVPS